MELTQNQQLNNETTETTSPYAQMLAEDTYMEERERKMKQRGQRRMRVLETASAEYTAQSEVQPSVVTDIFRGIGNGVVGLGQSIGSLADSTVEAFGGDLIEDESILTKKVFGETQTTAGRIFETAAQFATAMFPISFGVGAFAKLAGIGRLGTAVATGAITDFVAFKGNEERLSNLFEGTALENPISRYLAADEEDADLEGRIKNVIEGMGLGAIAEVVMASTKALRGMKKAKTPAEFEAAQAAAQAVAPQVEKAVIAAADAPTLKVGAPAEDFYTRSYRPELADVDPSWVKHISDQLTDIHKNNVDHLNFTSIAEAFDGITEQIAGHSISGNLYGKMIDQVFAAQHEAISKVVSNMSTKRGAVREFARDFVKGTTSLPLEYADRMINEVGASAVAVEEAMRTLLKGKLLDRALSKQSARIFTDLASDSLPEAARPAAEILGLQNLEQLGQLRTQLHRLISGSGRLLQSQNIKFMKLADVSIDTNLIKEVDTAAVGTMSAANKKALFTRLAAAGNAGSSSALIAAAKAGPNMADAMFEYYINSLLSGPGTSTINSITTGLNTILRPVERALGGVIRGDMTEVRQAVRTFGFMFRGVKDAMKTAWIATRSGVSPLTGEVSQRAISSDLVKGTALEWLGPGINWLGSVVRIPSRVLGGTDEFFKQIVYRAEMYSKYTDEALTKGILQTGYNGKLGADGVAAFVDDSVYNHIASGTRDADALAQAAKSTFTEDFKPNSAVSHIAATIARVPGLRLFVPFVKTPWNVLREAAGHTPLASQWIKSHRDALARGGREAAEVAGKIAFGNAVFVTGLIASMSGVISGSGGGLSRQERERRMLDGWRPYSVKIGDKYIEYGRLDPLGVVLGLASDYAEISQFVTPDEQQNMATLMVGALNQNITNKSYLKGLSDIMDVLTDVEGLDAGEALKRMTAAFMVPSAVKYVSNELDPYMREARELVDVIKARSFSQGLMPKRDMFGQPVEQPDQFVPGIKASRDVADPVRSEIAKLPASVGTPASKIGQVDLRQHRNADNQTALDRLQELTGTVTLNGGKTLHEYLADKMAKPEYKAMQDGADPTGVARAEIVERALTRYRAKARKQMLKEFPQIKQMVKAEKDVAVDARRAARTASLKTWVEQTVANERQ